MDTTVTRTSEAPVTTVRNYLRRRQGGCDFRLDQTINNRWQIAVLSPDARAWVREELCGPLAQCLSESFTVDILSADQFLKEARALGFRTEFIGKSGKDLF